jgi:RimJ/RimL family protein N-acetyltransferase
MVKRLAGKKINLREIEAQDWKAVHEYASQKIVSKYQSWGPNSEEESIAYVNEAVEDCNRDPQNRFVFSIVYKQTNSMIGAGELYIRSAVNREGELGYIIHPDYWGKGIATETAHLLVDYGFTHLNLHRIFATCDPRNIGSEKVLKKTGMKLEGRIRESILLKAGWRDSLLFSILEHEWRQNGQK